MDWLWKEPLPYLKSQKKRKEFNEWLDFSCVWMFFLCLHHLFKDLSRDTLGPPWWTGWVVLESHGYAVSCIYYSPRCSLEPGRLCHAATCTSIGWELCCHQIGYRPWYISSHIACYVGFFPAPSYNKPELKRNAKRVHSPSLYKQDCSLLTYARLCYFYQCHTPAIRTVLLT